MFTNVAYLHNSLNDMVDTSKSLVVTSCGYYRVHSRPVVSTERPTGRRDYQLLYIAKGKGHFYFDGLQGKETISNFQKEKYWSVHLKFVGLDAVHEKVKEQGESENIRRDCDGKEAIVKSVKTERKTVNPPHLYDLTTLQREANRLYDFTAQQTLDYMQSLYEKKLVTYPRTDSQYLSDDMEQTAYALIPAISEHFGFGSVAEPNLRAVINNRKVTGHHAIIPTESGVKCDISALAVGEQNILKLVALRLLCASASAYQYGAVKVILSCENTDFTASGKTVLESGWKALDGKIGEAEKSDEKNLPDLEKGMTFTAKAVKSEHFTSPPKSFTEDTLLSAMEHTEAEDFDENAEKKGLGTPATRANTIENLVKHGYIQRDGKKIISTDKGRNLIRVMPDEVKSARLTADWENKLLEVEHGSLSADSFMNEINRFVTELVSKYGSVDDSVSFGENQPSIGNCPKCGKPVIKGKYGWYCSARCGMNLTKVYGVELSEGQLKSLLSGKETSYIKSGRKTIVVPKVAENAFNGKTYYNWATRKESS